MNTSLLEKNSPTFSVYQLKDKNNATKFFNSLKDKLNKLGIQHEYEFEYGDKSNVDEMNIQKIKELEKNNEEPNFMVSLLRSITSVSNNDERRWLLKSESESASESESHIGLLKIKKTVCTGCL